MLNIIKNEVYKMFKTKKLYIFMLIIFVYNLFPALEQVTGAIDEAGVVMNGQNTAFYMLNFMITNILPIFIVVMIADMITGEYANGTLKLPLLHPVSRVKLLTAKMAALSCVLLCLLIFSMAISYGIGTAIFGWGEQFTYQEPGQEVQELIVYSTQEGIIATVNSYLISMFPLVAFGMVIMLIALVLNSSAVTVGISMGLIISTSILGDAVDSLKPFLIIDGFSLFKSLYVTQSMTDVMATMVMISVYFIGFGLASIYKFNKKELFY